MVETDNYQINLVYEGEIPNCSFFTSTSPATIPSIAIVSSSYYSHYNSYTSWASSVSINYIPNNTNVLSIVHNNGIESVYLNGVRIYRNSTTVNHSLNNFIIGNYADHINTFNIKGLGVYIGPNVYPDVDNVTVPTLPLQPISNNTTTPAPTTTTTTTPVPTTTTTTTTTTTVPPSINYVLVDAIDPDGSVITEKQNNFPITLTGDVTVNNNTIHINNDGYFTIDTSQLPLTTVSNYQIDFVYDGINIPNCSFFATSVTDPYATFAFVDNYIYAHSKVNGWVYNQPITSTTGTNTLSIVGNNGIESIYLNGIRINRTNINFNMQGNKVIIGNYPTYTNTNAFTIKGLRVYFGPNVYPDVDNVTVPTLPLIAL